MEALVREVDTELVKRIGMTRQVLWTRKIKEPDKHIKIVSAKMLVDMVVKPSEQERV